MLINVMAPRSLMGAPCEKRYILWYAMPKKENSMDGLEQLCLKLMYSARGEIQEIPYDIKQREMGILAGNLRHIAQATAGRFTRLAMDAR
jgi:hypothetical protein